MVVRAGQPSGWPVSLKAGTANPVRATTHEICSSGGGNNRYFKEVALMATTLTPSYPQFVFVFAAVRRADRKPRICMLRTVAGDEHAARRSLVRDYILSFAGRLPVAEVRA
ncbi:host cell division inhibitor Icd-like protein [Salmonella enterica]|nr:host cell division inhibitor Icd-like protein [Salmonella enterica]